MRLARSLLILLISCAAAACGDDAGESSPDAGQTGEPDAGETSTVPLACGSEEDDMRDGTIDVYWSFDYDDDDRMLLETGDHRDGGRADDQRWVWAYDERGNHTLLDWYEGDELSYHEESTYDADDNRLTHVSGFDGDTRAERYVYEDGLMTRKEVDEGNDEVVDAVHTFETDGERITSEAIDFSDEDSFDQQRTYRYEGGRLVAIETDDASDGLGDEDGDGELVDGIQTYEYDADGRTTEHVTDDDADGEPERTTTWARDEDGRVLERKIVYGPESDDLQLTTSYSYGEDGELLVLEMAGLTETRTTYVFDCAAEGRAGAAERAARVHAAVAERMARRLAR